jgi:hypothetical protein
MVPRTTPLYQGSLLRIQPDHYRGSSIILRDGTTIQHNDPVVGLHFDNQAMLRLASAPHFEPFSGERIANSELRQLAAMTEKGQLGEMRALHAVTPMSAALRRQGFEMMQLPHTPGYFFLRLYMTGLLALYHPRGWAGVSPQRASAWPEEGWMSRKDLLSRFLDAERN